MALGAKGLSWRSSCGEDEDEDGAYVQILSLSVQVITLVDDEKYVIWTEGKQLIVLSTVQVV